MIKTKNDPEFLFVYGTLREKIDHPRASLLKKYGKKKGHASFRGKLYDTGSYPAAVPSKKETDNIYGEFYEVKDPELIFGYLDEYEGYYPHNQQQNSLFIRKEVTIRVSGEGGLRTAWIYLYNRSVGGLKQIEGGNYLEYLQSGKN